MSVTHFSGLDSDEEKKRDAMTAERDRDRKLLRLIESQDMQLLQKVGTRDVSGQQRAAAAARRAREADLKARKSLNQDVGAHSLAAVRASGHVDMRMIARHDQSFEDALSGEEDHHRSFEEDNHSVRSISNT